jgi:hypothetical protein
MNFFVVLLCLLLSIVEPSYALWPFDGGVSDVSDAAQDAFMKTIDAVYYPGWKMGHEAAKPFIAMTGVDEATQISRFIRATCLSQAAGAAMANVVPGVGIPLGLALSLETQVALATGIASIRGYDMSSPEKSRALVGLFLVGDLTAEAAKFIGAKSAEHVAKGMLTQISGRVLIAINKQVGMRLFTKHGTKGVFNLGNMIPGLGIAIAGSIDGVFCFFAATGIEKMTFRGEGHDERCMSDILDDFGAAHMKKKVVEEMGIVSSNFCQGVPLQVLRQSLDDKVMVDFYLLLLKNLCTKAGRLEYKCNENLNY